MPTLLQRIADGDDSAVEACIDEYGGLIWRLARRYLGHAGSDAEDAVQEIFVELWIAAERFNPSKGSEPAFVATLAHRRLTDWQRRAGARSRLIKGYASNTTPRQASLQLAEPKGDRADEAAAALGALPEVEKDALTLWLYRGMTQKQIGEATDAPIGTVKSRVRRGLLKVCDALGVGLSGGVATAGAEMSSGTESRKGGGA